MKRRWVLFLVGLLLAVMFLCPRVGEAADAAGDYRSRATGNWGDASTWERYDGSDWVAASAGPTSADGVITIRNGHTVTIAAGVTVDQVVVEAGGQVTISSGQTMTLANGADVTDLTIAGTLLNQGTFTRSSSKWAVSAGGTYIHNTTTPIAAPLDGATLNTTSNFIYRGSSLLTPAISMSGRTYGHLSLESTAGSWSTGALSGSTATIIQGNFTLGSGVTLNNSAFAGFTLAGDWTNNGTFTAGTGKVTFNRSGTSTIGGLSATTFYTLEVSSNTTLDVGTSTLFDATNSVRNYGKLKQTQTVGTASVAFLNLSSGTYRGVELDPSGLISLGSTTVTIYGEQSCPTPPSLGVTTIKRCFDIAPATATTATVKFWYDATNELNFNTQGSEKAYYQEGGLWHEATGTYTRASGTFNSVQVDGVSVFSRFALTSNPPSTSNLITLTRFDAMPASGGIVITWETASEVNTAGFHLWRASQPAGRYVKITAALLPGRGGPTRSAAYTYTDAAVAPGAAYYYRLEEVDGYGLSAFYGPAEAVAGLAGRPISRCYLPLLSR